MNSFRAANSGKPDPSSPIRGYTFDRSETTPEETNFSLFEGETLYNLLGCRKEINDQSIGSFIAGDGGRRTVMLSEHREET